MKICDLKGCNFHGAIIPLNGETCAAGFEAPNYLKSVTSLSVSISSEEGDDDGVVDNLNGCRNTASACSGEVSLEARICNTSNTGQNHLLCDSYVLLVVYKHDGEQYDDDWANVPAEELVAFGGYAKISNIDYSLIAGRNEYSTVSATFTLDAGKFTYAPLRNETEQVTVADLCALAA